MHFLFYLPPCPVVLSMAPRPSSPPVSECPEGRHMADTLHPKPGSSETRLASGTTQTKNRSSCPPGRLRSLPLVAHGEPPEVTTAQFRLHESSKRGPGGRSRHCMGVWGCFISSLSLPPSAAAAAAKSLQSCPTLCDPMDCSPPGSAVSGILQARTLEWVAISFSSAIQ